MDENNETGDNTRSQCDFCGATYNLKSRAPVTKEGGKLVRVLFSKSDNVPLPVYGLGEQDGKVFWNSLLAIEAGEMCKFQRRLQ